MASQDSYAPVVALDSYRKQPCPAKVGALRLAPPVERKQHRVWLSGALCLVVAGWLGVAVHRGPAAAQAHSLPPVTVTSVVYLPEIKAPIVHAPATATCSPGGCRLPL